MPSLHPKPFVNMELALRVLLRRDLGVTYTGTFTVGRDLPGDVTDLYIRIQKVPGSRSDRLEGDFVFDIETFHPDYLIAESAGMDIEALVLRYPHIVKVGDQQVVFDRVTQNMSPSEIPWDDDNVHRLLATYVITVRR